jgi:hypothetical protein
LLTALLVTVLGVIVSSLPVSGRTRLLTLLGFGAWALLVVTLGAFGAFVPGAIGPIPAAPIACAFLLAAGVTAWLRYPPLREAVLSIPLTTLVGLNIGRLLGGFFLFLYAAGRLPAPFAPAAGWGDVAVGALALPLLGVIAGGGAGGTLVRLWNGFGALELVVAVALGALSAPGVRWQVFTDAPGTALVGTLPWVMIPTLLVPIYLMLHFAIATKLRLWALWNRGGRAEPARQEASEAAPRGAAGPNNRLHATGHSGHLLAGVGLSPVART